MPPRNKENKEVKSPRKGNRSSDVNDSDDEEYRKRRDRNNQAVKRSRVKSRLRTQLTVERVNKLKTENELLQEKVKFLTKELGFLKDLFMAQASNSGTVNLKDVDLEALLKEEPKPEETKSKAPSTSRDLNSGRGRRGSPSP